MSGTTRAGAGRPTPRRRTLLRAGAAAGALGAAGWWLLPDGDGGPRGRITFATGVPTGVYERYGTLLDRRLARDVPALRMRLVPSQGSVQNIDMLISGRADVTIAQSDAVAAYLNRGGRDAGRLRACARLYDDYMQLIVPADAPVRDVSGLRGLRVGLGEARSGVSLSAGRLLAAAGLGGPEDLTRVAAGIDEMPGLLERGELDAFFWSGGLPTSAIQQLAARLPVRLVPLGGLLSLLHGMKPETRHYRAAVVPADAYPGVQGGEPVPTVAIANLLVTTDRMDAGLVEALTRSLINSRDQIGSEVHAAQKVDLRTAIYTDPLPLHRGAERYYRAVKP
ncbi:TAXI family TRAP transporter solute-binding subunit [Streptomyces sp. JJ36]|uniref:TAXI family TRAP transporter solute-binding subunit n=1 Tax=Streptomyces sp. JJ36 TaxID=2736645 RepID=UPI001F0095F3|nr:TAXI family TRAP transporter solute-binding subunit [Streptomyces sp. JJ36]MCF6523919.1 TAXI family TRAP transporter solute-binding subunit [Streptomyces sp. JJ36]